jgi:hypothetical protein
MSGRLLLDPTPGHEDAVEFIGWAGLHIVRVHVCGVGMESSQVQSGPVRSNQVGWAAAAGFGAGRGRKKKHTEKQKQKQSKDENPDVHGARVRADATVTPCACRLSSRFVSSLSLFFSPPAPLVLHPELAFAVRSLDPCGYPFGYLVTR